MERRDFLKTCFYATSAGAVMSVAMQSCKSVHYASAELENSRLKISKSEFTDQEGQKRAFVVVRNDKLDFPIAVYLKNIEQRDKFIALSTRCTHSGCEVQPNKVSLVCPCHGSEFSTDGAVMNPPAERDLKQYHITTDNENIYVQI